jgi:hypothetical protein
MPTTSADPALLARMAIHLAEQQTVQGPHRHRGRKPRSAMTGDGTRRRRDREPGRAFGPYRWKSFFMHENVVVLSLSVVQFCCARGHQLARADRAGRHPGHRRARHRPHPRRPGPAMVLPGHRADPGTRRRRPQPRCRPGTGSSRRQRPARGADRRAWPDSSLPCPRRGQRQPGSHRDRLADQQAPARRQGRLPIHGRRLGPHD